MSTTTKKPSLSQRREHIQHLIGLLKEQEYIREQAERRLNQLRYTIGKELYEIQAQYLYKPDYDTFEHFLESIKSKSRATLFDYKRLYKTQSQIEALEVPASLKDTEHDLKVAENVLKLANEARVKKEIKEAQKTLRKGIPLSKSLLSNDTIELLTQHDAKTVSPKVSDRFQALPWRKSRKIAASVLENPEDAESIIEHAEQTSERMISGSHTRYVQMPVRGEAATQLDHLYSVIKSIQSAMDKGELDRLKSLVLNKESMLKLAVDDYAKVVQKAYKDFTNT